MEELRFQGRPVHPSRGRLRGCWPQEQLSEAQTPREPTSWSCFSLCWCLCSLYKEEPWGRGFLLVQFGSGSHFGPITPARGWVTQ